jgi:DMSO/TMAO reductase YedYZ heme-binding membrane subunit
MLALLLLIPLAATSTASMQRRLGRRWAHLHRLIYGIAVLGVWHYWWGVKEDIREPLAFACILGVLLAYRIYGRYRAKSRVREGAILMRADSIRVSRARSCADFLRAATVMGFTHNAWCQGG